MFSWVRALLRAEEGSDTTGNARRYGRVTRQELVAIFADDLANKVLQKHTRSSGAKPRRFMAGRHYRTIE